MTTYYVDTSALAKRCVDEVGSDWLRATLGTKPSPSIVIAHLTIVEMTSALMRRLREGRLTPAEYTQTQSLFQSDCLAGYEIVVAVGDVVNQANRLLETHPLRAYDAVHLAVAVSANRRLVDGDLPPLGFLSADDRLNDAATAEGLVVENPSRHPSDRDNAS